MPRLTVKAIQASFMDETKPKTYGGFFADNGLKRNTEDDMSLVPLN